VGKKDELARNCGNFAFLAEGVGYSFMQKALVTQAFRKR
jgi:hypothetical protein